MSSESKRRVRLGVESLEDREVMTATLTAGPLAVGNGVIEFDSSRAVARSDNGNTVVVWAGPNDGNPLYARLYNSTGAALTGAIAINGTNRTCDYDPSVAIARNGQFVVAWERVGGTAGSHDVLAAEFDNTGRQVTGAIPVATSGQDEMNPSVATNPAGQWAVAYESRYSGADTDIYVRQYGTPGHLIRTIAVDTSTSPEYTPTIDMNPSGQFVVGYLRQYSGADYDVYARSYNWAGTQLTSVTIADSYSMENFPSAAIDGSGNYVVAYQLDGSPMSQVMAQRVSNTGQRLGGPIGVGYNNLHPEYSPSVDMAYDGRFVVAYESDWSSSDRDIVAQQYDPSGNAVSSPIYIEGSTNYEYQPSLGMDNYGNFSVVYNAFTQSNTSLPVSLRLYRW